MNVLAESSDAVQIATLITQMIGAVFGGYLAYLMARLNVQAKSAATASSNAAAAVENVRTTLVKSTTETDDKLEGLVEIGVANHELGKQTHQLVNGGLAPLLKAAAEDSEFKANATGNDGDRARAEASREMYDNHMKIQTKQ